MATVLSAYVVLQEVTLATLRRSYRRAAGTPLPPMLLIAFASFDDRARGCNQWPLAMIFVSPVVVLYLLAVVPEGLRVQAHPRRGQLCAFTCAFAAAGCLPYACAGTVLR